ncbi:glycosyltransferase family 2 protein [Marinibacterium sp. SX1]|uniref:glycosyltransferase family 2 protein n=1 Tax=Marinibacterium sp. SX1 TaxID=3388424 RepID=UPI003D16CB01
MPEATVIIAAWNAAETIDRCVRSALSQTDVTVEAIVVDDASPDDTSARADATGARVFRLPENGGPAVARNRALDEARTDWLAVLDSDDTMADDRLSRMISVAETHGADVVLGNFRYANEDGAPLVQAPFLPCDADAAPQHWSFEHFVAGNQVTPGSRALGYLKPLFRRSFLENHKIRYNPALRNGEDCHMIYACLAAGARVVFDPLPGYNYTVRRGSISHRVDPRHIDALMAADAAFVQRHAAELTPKLKALFASRHDGLSTLKQSEEAMIALKSGRPATAVAALAKKPSATGRFARQLLEAGRKRIK